MPKPLALGFSAIVAALPAFALESYVCALPSTAPEVARFTISEATLNSTAGGGWGSSEFILISNNDLGFVAIRSNGNTNNATPGVWVIVLNKILRSVSLSMSHDLGVLGPLQGRC